MAKSNFTRVMDHIFKHEGGYVNHRDDPGGATNMGITHATLSAWRGERVTAADVKALSKEEARQIYKARYWNVVKADHLPYGFDYATMDGAVNSGPRQGVKWLQRGIGTKADGVVGPNTIEASRRSQVTGIERACAARMSFLRGLRHWSTFKRGWSRRVAEVEAVSTTMWLQAAEGTIAARDAAKSKAKEAPQKAKAQNKAGKAQVGATGATGASGATALASQTELVMVFVLLAIVGFVALLAFLRSRRREQYQLDRADAYSNQVEEI